MALYSALIALGLVLVIAGAKGWLPELGLNKGDAGADYATLRILLAVAGFVSVLLWTGWPVAAIYAAFGGFMAPSFVLARRRRRESVERIEAIATWTENVRDTMAASAGLQQALALSARIAPAPIRPEVRALSVRLQHQSTAESLRVFAIEMEHPLTDMVVAALVLASTRHAGSLQEVLNLISQSARETSAMWRQVEASRARTFGQAAMAAWVTAGMMIYVIATRREIVDDAYNGIVGQIALLVVLGMFVFGIYWIYRLAKPIPPKRMFANVERWSELEGRVMQ